MSTEFFLYVVHTKHYDMADHIGELYKFGYTKDIGSRIDGYKTGFYYKMRYKVFFYIDIPIKNFDGIEFESLIKAELKKADKKKEKDDEMYRLKLDKIIEITESKLDELKKMPKYKDFIFKKVTDEKLLKEPKIFMFDKIQELIKEFDNIKNGNKISKLALDIFNIDAKKDKIKILEKYESENDTQLRCILCNRSTSSGFEVEYLYFKHLEHKPDGMKLIVGPNCGKKFDYCDEKFMKSIKKIFPKEEEQFSEARDYYIENKHKIEDNDIYMLLMDSKFFKNDEDIIEKAKKFEVEWYSPYLIEILVLHKMYKNSQNYISGCVVELYINELNKKFGLYFSQAFLKKHLSRRSDKIFDYCLEYNSDKDVYIVSIFIKMEKFIHNYINRKSKINDRKIPYNEIIEKNLEFLIEKGKFYIKTNINGVEKNILDTENINKFLEHFKNVNDNPNYKLRVKNSTFDSELFILTHQQLKVVEMLIKSDLAIVNSGGGTGKTELSMFIEYYFHNKNFRIMRLCPTNKAKSVIINKRMKNKYETNDMTLQKFVYMFEKLKNKHKNGNPIQKMYGSILFIIDEISMIDLKLMNKFIECVNDIYVGKNKFLFIGDSNQLRPVEFGRAVDILKRFESNTIKLTIQKRQDFVPIYLKNILDMKKYKIKNLENSKYEVNEKSKTRLRFKEYDEKNFNKMIIKIYEKYDKNIQFITHENNTRKTINKIIKKYETNNEFSFITGDKIIFTVNKGVDLFNGLCAIIRESEYINERIVRIKYSKIINKNEYSDEIFESEIGANEIQHSYCLTIHNSQGSEYKNVCFVINYPEIRQNGLQSDLIYTAMSRHSDSLCVLTDRKNVVENIIINKKPEIKIPFFMDLQKETIEKSHVHFAVPSYNPLFKQFEDFVKKNSISDIEIFNYTGIGGNWKTGYNISNYIPQEKYKLIKEFQKMENVGEKMIWINGCFCDKNCDNRK